MALDEGAFAKQTAIQKPFLKEKLIFGNKKNRYIRIIVGDAVTCLR